MSIVTSIPDKREKSDRGRVDFDGPLEQRNTSAKSADAPARPMSMASSLGAKRRILEVSEFAAIVGSALVVKAIYIDAIIGSNANWLPYVLTAVMLGAVFHVTGKHMGLHNVEKLTGPVLHLGKLFGGLVISFLVVLGILYMFKEAEALSRIWIFSWLALSAVSLMTLRALMVGHIARVSSSGGLSRRVAIVGTREFATELSKRIAGAEVLVGDIDLYDVEPQSPDDRFVRSLFDLQKVMQSNSYDWVIIAMPKASPDKIRKVVRLLGAYTTELMVCTDLMDPLLPTDGVRHIGDVRADVVHSIPGSEISWIMKRAMDMSFAAIALVLLSPLFAIVALLIKLDSSGPVFFLQHRIGKNNVPFTIFKFRTMVVLENGPVVIQATRGDARVTRVGRFLRAASIDELPQLLNVLLGDMSLVGPRPHAITHDNDFEQQFDLFARRRRVSPGITGWAQVQGFRGETKTAQDIQRRMECDLYYINNWSIWLDIEIMVRTLFVLTKGAF